MMVHTENFLDHHDAALGCAGRFGTVRAELELIGCGEGEMLAQVVLLTLRDHQNFRAPIARFHAAGNRMGLMSHPQQALCWASTSYFTYCREDDVMARDKLGQDNRNS
jgi:hypothetical protein